MSTADMEAMRDQLNRLSLELRSLQSKQGVEKISIGNYLLTRLAQLGVKASRISPSMFGVPGDYNLGFLDLVEDHPAIDWIGNCNELNAAYAADGYARMKPNSLGVITTTFGVGELSASNGIAGAFSEMVPVMHIVGVPSTTQQKERPLLHHTLGDGRFTAYSEIAKQITTFTAWLDNKDTAPRLIDEAIVNCMTRARPVYLSMPTDFVHAEVPSDRLHTPLSRNIAPNDPQTEEFVLNQIEERVKAVNGNVVVLVDACVMRYDVKTEAMDFLKRTNFPVYAAPMGKTAIDETWTRYGGIYVGSITDAVIKNNVEKAGLVISLGSLRSDFNSGSFTYGIPTNRHIELHSSHTQIQYAYYPDVGFKHLLPKLTERLQGFSALGTKIPVAPFRAQLPSRDAPNEQRITQRFFWPRLASFFKPNDVILTETGTANFGILDVPLPEKTHLLSQILYGSIGWSVGATLGAALAARERGLGRVILFVGDGSMQLTCQELSPMIGLGLKPIVFLLNNEGYVIERTIHGMHRKYNDIANWKWTQLLDTLGDGQTKTKSVTVSTRKEFEQLIADPQFANPSCITLVEVMMDRFDAPRLLEDNVAASQKSAMSTAMGK